MTLPDLIEVNHVYQMDALELLKALPDASVDLIATDPPFNIDKAAWDSWPTLDAFLEWLDSHLVEFRRVLKPNGSLYLFCATKYAAKVELTVGNHFNVLNTIRWRKPEYSTKAEMNDKTAFRGYFPSSEGIIFAEQQGENVGQADRDAELWAQLSRPLKAWFRSEAHEHGISPRAINNALGSATSGGGMATHYIGTGFTFELPTPEMFRKLKAVFPKAFNRDYIELSREYENLKREYDDLRRPFYATPDAPYTDVWDFATVNTYPGKHPCEKPMALCQHIIRVSSRPDAIVLDPFCGSGNMLRAAWIEGRRYIGGDKDAYWVKRSSDSLRLPFEPRLAVPEIDFTGLPLFEHL